MELGSPSPYPQVPATCPYPESTPSSPNDPLQLPEDPSLYYPPIYVVVSLMASFPQSSPPTVVTEKYVFLHGNLMYVLPGDDSNGDRNM
jgi:hypothetical protein